jgi:hypothetical protein
MDYCNNNKVGINKDIKDKYKYLEENIYNVSQNQIAYTMYVIFHMIMSLIAIYLSWKCNKGFDLTSFIIALIFPYLYIMYIFATNGTCGIISTENIKK